MLTHFLQSLRGTGGGCRVVKLIGDGNGSGFTAARLFEVGHCAAMPGNYRRYARLSLEITRFVVQKFYGKRHISVS